MKKENLRYYVKIRCILGVSPKNIWKELKSALNKQSPTYAFVTKWVRLFKSGKKEVEDAPRSGRPITATIDANIDQVRSVIEDDPNSTFDEIEAATSLSRGTISAIIHDHLKLRKITSRWVPHHLTAKNRRERVSICKENLAKFNDGRWRLCDVITGDESWFYHRKIGRRQSSKTWVAEGEGPRTVVNREQSEAKTMFSVFFKSTGLVHINHLDKGKTIDHKFYIEKSLKPVVESLKLKRPNSGLTNLKFHHDNAKPHVTKAVKKYLAEQKLTLIRHPPYSPDLAPCDFWLFDYVKQRLTDQPDAESLEKQITEILENIPEEEYLKTFLKWLERMKHCIFYKGDYFEHLLQ